MTKREYYEIAWAIHDADITPEARREVADVFCDRLSNHNLSFDRKWFRRHCIPKKEAEAPEVGDDA